jgi:hypothetical protein
MVEEFNISDWRSKHLFTENQNPQDIESIEEVGETEKHESLIDEIGEFWVVTKPNTKSNAEDLFFEIDIFGLVNKLKGELNSKDIMGIYIKRGEAARRAKELIKQRDTDLKEIEGAMNDYRDTKKSVDDKRLKATEIIKRLK